MKIWFDCEFAEHGVVILPISIGMVREDNQTLYIESIDFDTTLANKWVRQHVIPKLYAPQVPLLTDELAAEKIKEFAGKNPEFWAYYGAYDWVMLCQLYGPMIDLPEGWPMYCRDVKQLCDDLGNPRLPKQTTPKHHALNDALWTREIWEDLMDLKRNWMHR